jgi:hypothetical protein
MSSESFNGLSSNIQNSFSMMEDNSLPYEAAITFFRNYKEVQSPIHKLKVIVQTSEKTDECMRDFYKVKRYLNRKQGLWDLV